MATPTKPWVYDDETFARELDRGHRYQVLFAQRLSNAGVPKSQIQISRHELRKDWKDRKRFANEMDLVACGQRIEVKSRRVRFSGPEDYPMTTAIVDTKAGWDRRRPKPLALGLISQYVPWGIAIVYAETFDRWEVHEVEDRKRGGSAPFYFVARSHLASLDDLARRLTNGRAVPLRWDENGRSNR